MTDLRTIDAVDAADGELLIRTGVAGRAARMGHRLTIAATRWHASVNWAGGAPAAAELVVEVDSFEVLRGEGGLKGLSGPEKAIARINALKALSSKRFPDIRFCADQVEQIREITGGYRLSGTLLIRGKSGEHVVEVRTEDLGDSWRVSVESQVRQTDYGVKPFSLLMGSLKVADEVTVSCTAVLAKDG